MGSGVDILIAISEKHLHYSLFVKRIIAVEAQLHFLGLVGRATSLTYFITCVMGLKLVGGIFFTSFSSFVSRPHEKTVSGPYSRSWSKTRAWLDHRYVV